MDRYHRELGSRLRAVRRQLGLSLHDVEQRSHGRWKAAVVGSYERGDRAVTVGRLAELAGFYGVPVARLVPDPPQPSQSAPATGAQPPVSNGLALDLEELARAGRDGLEALRRYVEVIRDRRGDYNGQVLTLRRDDAPALAAVLPAGPGELETRLAEWRLLRPGQPVRRLAR